MSEKRRMAKTAASAIVGFLCGMLLYQGVTRQGDQPYDVVKFLIENCGGPGMTVNFTVSEGALSHWECESTERE